MSSFNPGMTPVPLGAVALRVRKNRDRLLGGDLFSDPAWDILLILKVKGPKSEADLLLSLNLSDSVVCRWTKLLVERELVQRGSDHVLSLTDSASRALDKVFSDSLSVKPVEV